MNKYVIYFRSVNDNSKTYHAGGYCWSSLLENAERLDSFKDAVEEVNKIKYTLRNYNIAEMLIEMI
jgi:hypothetical protein